MLTARADETDLVIGLGVGADDYLSKPFSMRELVARVRALLRRADRAATALQGSGGSVQLGDLEVNFDERRVRRGVEEVHLTRTEFDLLAYLASRPRVALSRDQIVSELWGWGDGAGNRTVDTHVKSLRRKIGGERIRTVHGVGYALEVPR
jgi:DNA-binding response OmpR family regulator